MRRYLVRVLPLGVGVLVGAVLLFLLLHTVNATRLGNSFADADVRYLLLAIIPFCATIWFKVLRWAVLFGRDAPSFGTLFAALNAGYAANTLVPLRLGELIAAAWLRDHAGISIVRSLSTIALERVCDGIAVFILLLVTAPSVAFPRTLLIPALTIGALLTAGLLVMLGLIHGVTGQRRWLERRLGALEAGKAARLVHLARHALDGLQALRDPGAIARFLAYTALIWVSNSVLIWLLVRAFGLNAPLVSGFLLTGVLYLGMAVPSSPGYIGVFDYLMVLTLGLYNMPRTPAVAAAFAAHAVLFIPVTIVGLVYLGRQGFRSTIRLLGAADSVSSG